MKCVTEDLPDDGLCKILHTSPAALSCDGAAASAAKPLNKSVAPMRLTVDFFGHYLQEAGPQQQLQ